jgi:hypothetical protein
MSAQEVVARGKDRTGPSRTLIILLIVLAIIIGTSVVVSMGGPSRLIRALLPGVASATWSSTAQYTPYVVLGPSGEVSVHLDIGDHPDGALYTELFVDTQSTMLPKSVAGTVTAVRWSVPKELTDPDVRQALLDAINNDPAAIFWQGYILEPKDVVYKPTLDVINHP